MLSLSKSAQRSVIFATIIGGILEWYEIFLYAYWAPVISRHFFYSKSQVIAELNVLAIFAIGFLSRPIGGLIFGHIGDRYGRKAAFLASMFTMTAPSFIIGVLPSYEQIGFLAPLALGLTRLLQGLPAGGELPGAMCYLIESAPSSRKKYMSSYTFLGVQIGVIIAILEFLVLEKYLSQSALDNLGWRLSFIFGGFLGLFGFYLRKKLRETPLFEHLEKESRIIHKPIIQSIKRHKKQLLTGFACSILATVGFFVIAVFPGIYFDKTTGISSTNNSIIILCLLLVSSITLPFFGSLGDRFRVKQLLSFSAICIILFSPVFYYALDSKSIFFVISAELLLVLFLNFQFALLPSLLAGIFPITVRYTCVGLSFNLCDSIIGGITPILTFYLLEHTGNIASFFVVICIAAIISLVAIALVKKEQHI